MVPTYKGITVHHPTVPEMITGVPLVTQILTRELQERSRVIAITKYLHQVTQLTVTAHQAIHQVLWVIIQPPPTALVLITVRQLTVLIAFQPIHRPIHYTLAAIQTTVIHATKKSD